MAEPPAELANLARIGKLAAEPGMAETVCAADLELPKLPVGDRAS